MDTPRRRLQGGARHPRAPSSPARQKPGRIFIRIIAHLRASEDWDKNVHEASHRRHHSSLSSQSQCRGLLHLHGRGPGPSSTSILARISQPPNLRHEPRPRHGRRQLRRHPYSIDQHHGPDQARKGPDRVRTNSSCTNAGATRRTSPQARNKEMAGLCSPGAPPWQRLSMPPSP